MQKRSITILYPGL